MSKFEYNAPQFSNLTNDEDSDEADTFFGKSCTDH